MKLHFESDLDYQISAIEAVCDLFRGQEQSRSVFSVVREAIADAPVLPGYDFDGGTGNRLTLLDDQIEANLREIQQRNGIKPSGEVKKGGYDFTVEMETGTGKTYVYLRTIFELNRRFGFSKFLIVVPSVAIKEGVFKTLQITREHFSGLYANETYEFFLYDSGKLGQVRTFATSPSIQIMVMTKASIDKKDINTIYEPTEKLNDLRPVTLIQQTRPIVIVDEPQSVDGGAEGSGRKALAAMHPLCTLRYSATHVDKHHMVFRLDAVDAYQRKLVKQIEVASLQVDGGHNKAYVKLISVGNKRGRWRAKLELDVQELSGVRRVQKEVGLQDDLEAITGRELYAGLVVEAMRTDSIELRGQELPLQLGQAIGAVDADALKRLMIRRTIEEHLEKELRLRSKDIKVLSLFFIDSVEHYRTYALDGTPGKGKYAVMFEEEYAAAIKKEKYRTLFKDVDTSTLPEDVHNGYFSQDKSGRLTESMDEGKGNQASRENAARAYELIMKKKEELLSFETKLKFLFSHSALREGWDNPNVFQICVLRDMGTEMARRQSIGRGLRLCVNQKGERLRGFDVNTLTVVASESYEDFAENLQREIEADGFRFGIVEEHQFAQVLIGEPDGTSSALGFDRSKALWGYLRASGYVDDKGKVQDSLRSALKNESLLLPAAFEAVRAQVQAVLRKLAGKLEIKNAANRERVNTREKVLNGEAFKALWDRIKHRTTYRLSFDNEKLIHDCAEALRKSGAVVGARVQIRKAEIEIDKGGVTTTETAASAPIELLENDVVLPDVITALEERTQLTRRSIVRILTESGRVDDLKKNAQQFMAQAEAAIVHTKRLALVDGIRYQRIGDDVFYGLELFNQEELKGYLADMLKDENEKCVYDHIRYDSAVERSFAEALEKNEAVKVFAKLPPWFQIPTPLGPYNPDWAVLVEVEGAEKVYFVVETKGSLYADALRAQELKKIDCGRAHFQALSLRESPVHYLPATTLDEVMNHATAEAR